MNWFRKLRKTDPSPNPPQAPKAPAAPLPPAPRAPAAPPMPAEDSFVSHDFDIASNDPLLAYILNSPNVIDINKLKLDSPALRELKNAGVRLTVPLVSQGELIGLLNLGPRLSEADYSSDDLRLLGNLATQAAPALRVAQLARQQQVEARQRERMEQELRVARVVQQTLLPQSIPTLEGYRIAAEWQPARAVSGDFYDFISFPDGRMGFIVADVTDKGVPAAIVMASSRSVLRSVAEQLILPGAVLEQANNLLCPNMPAKMFVTCLYAVLEPVTGILRYANAGHNPPFQRSEQVVTELRARGMPLGLFPDMAYEEKVTTLAMGDHVMIYSDGLVEAHDPQGEMFGYPRMRHLMALPECGPALIQCMLNELHGFTGDGWEQEDDVTFVTLERLPVAAALEAGEEKPLNLHSRGPHMDLLAEFSLPSQPGGERQVIEQVSAALEPLDLDSSLLERMKTAVGEAAMNAMEHGNHYRQDMPIYIQVRAAETMVSVSITDQGGETPIPEAEIPDLDAKLAGLQSARGWGLFLIKSMVDELRVSADGAHHTVELIFKGV